MIMISQNVSETILTLRWYLVGKIIRIKSSLSSEGNSDNTEPLSMVMDYNLLIHSFQKIRRVMSRY
jgi:DNA primase